MYGLKVGCSMTMAQTTDNTESSGLKTSFLEEVAIVIKVLGHPERIRIVEYIENSEMKVSDIQKHLSLTQPVTSQHLRLMRDRGILRSRRDGTCVYYSLATPLVHKMLACLAETQRQMYE
jgi:ArsR family transcriptional regulator